MATKLRSFAGNSACSRRYGPTASVFRLREPLRMTLRSFSESTTSSRTIPPGKQKYVPQSGTYPQGFTIGSLNVGIKPADTFQPDLVLVASESPSNGAAVFTKNEFAAPSVIVSRDIIKRTGGHGLRGVIANSGCSNLLTGEAGLGDTTAMSQEAGRHVSVDSGTSDDSPFMVMHTGKGATRLPMREILQGIPKIREIMGNSHGHWVEAAHGLLTTDTFPKLASRTFTLPSSPGVAFSIAGVTKGAGMIHPNMATTLGILCTDAPVTPAALQQVLATAADKSYNCISIDGDTSTNDMVAMLANGAAGGSTVDFDPAAAKQSQDFAVLQRVLVEFMAELAKLVVRDGEGATKFITIRVRGAPSYAAGRHIASAIARSLLVKTAIYGGDPNWAGMLVVLGYSLADTKFAGQGIIVPHKTSLSFIPVDGKPALEFFKRGVPMAVDEARVKQLMEQEDVEVVVNLRDHAQNEEQDAEEAVYWTCDLTHDFVTVNSDFRV